MSYKSSLTNSVRSQGGSCRNENSIHEKLHSTPSTEEKIKFAGDESKDRLYEPKQNKKMMRVLTVIIYVFSVSLAAIMLSLYYVFFWNPSGPHYVASKMQDHSASESVGFRQDNDVTNRKPTALPSRCLENHDGNSTGQVEAVALPFKPEIPYSETNSTNTTTETNTLLEEDLNSTEEPSSTSLQGIDLDNTMSNSILLTTILKNIRNDTKSNNT